MKNSNKGAFLIEILLSIGIFVMWTMVIGFLLSGASFSPRQSVERLQAILLAQEGLEAARSMRDGDFDNLTVGPHGLAISNNKWVFSGVNDIQDKFTRQVTLSDIDTYTKKIVSIVNWITAQNQPDSISFTAFLTDWKQSSGQSENLRISLDSAKLENGNQTLRGFVLENIGTQPITINKITVWWQDASGLIQEIRLGDRVWANNGPGLPSGKQPSGTELDIEDLTIQPGISISDTWFKFNGPISVTNFVVKFSLSSGIRFALINL